VGSEDPVVAVAVDARGRNEAGQALKEFKGCEAKRLATVHIGLREPVDQPGLRRGERSDAGTMPVVALTGPRQSGKTTLRRATFPDHAYVSLEPIATRDFAASDPRGFLSQYSGPVILDEVQRVPDFFSYIQEEVDRAPEHGRFILTGSEHFRLSQARTGQEVNLSALGSDAGVSHNTAHSWLSVLESSFVLFQIPPWLRNVRKRVIKAPKLHFVDSGLACHLLGIHEPGQLRMHPLRGALFESWVASEVLKWRVHRGLPSGLFHLRETRGLELDLVVETVRALIPVEVKSGQTVASDFLDGLRSFTDRTAEAVPHLGITPRLVYGGERSEARTGATVVPWRGLHDVSWE